MDGVRKMATAYYERAGTEERKKVIEFFNKLDSKGDGNISLEEYREGADSWYANDRIFGQLDADGDGKLQFSDVVVLYYMQNKLNLHKCDVCRELLAGLFFTCASCFVDGNPSYDLCSECYRRGDCQPHKHPLSDFTNQNALHSSVNAQKREIAELSKIAHAHYRAAPENIRALANDFFKSMDIDGDGRIDLAEFLSFMKNDGYPEMSSTQFFKILDKDDSGTLEFDEVVTLYYIVKSGRPFCDMCRLFIPGMFFSCVECYNNREESPYYLCRDCYFSGKCKHSHNGRAQFLDNYLMLEFTRYTETYEPATSTQQAGATHTPNPSNANTIIPANKNNYDVKMLALQLIGGALSSAITACSIL